jgi:CAAX amino terminal protease family.
MGEKIKNKPVAACWIMFAILILVHGFEAIVLRMDETFFGENFINKVFGIVLIFVVLALVKWAPKDIGFTAKNFLRNIGIGFLLAAVVFVIAYGVEVIILKSQGLSVTFGVFITGFSLTGETEVHTGIGFILMCIFFNIVNVVMEEGTFRGLFFELVSAKKSMKTALFFQAFLFGVWHIVTPLHNLIDGDIDAASFIGLGVGYIILAGLMGIKWGLLYKMTGSLYAGMADHFFNNCIATNLLHVSTENGIDEMMLIRVLVAQVLSFIIVAVIWSKKKQHISG